MRYLLFTILILVASRASAADQAPRLPQATCPCGDVCQCKPGSCPGSCPVLLTVAAPVRVCDANGCRLVLPTQTSATGFPAIAAAGQFMEYRATAPRGPVRGFLCRLFGRCR